MSDRNEAGRGMVLVGTVVKPHGIRGEVCVEHYADSPELFQRGQIVFLGQPRKKNTRLSIRTVRQHKGRLLLTLQGVDDRNAAELLRGAELYVPESQLPELDDGDFYLRDLLGLTVQQADGTELGVLERFFEAPGQITWVVIHSSGREILLPAVDAFVDDIDLESGIITVQPPEGLVELYLAPRSAQKDE